METNKLGGSDINGGPDSWSPQMEWMRQSLDEVVTLLAEDIRDARMRLGVSMTLVAEHAGLEPDVYRAIEEGRIPADETSLSGMVSAAYCLGLKDVRVSFFEEYQLFMKLDLSEEEGPLTFFVDTLHLNIKRLKKEHVWVNPSQVLTLLARDDPDKTLTSRRLIDKQLIELWVAAVYSLCYDRGQNYYVRLVERDPPDAEVLAIDDAGLWSRIGVEVTQHGSHSSGLIEVIKKKLRVKYSTGTVIVVLVEQAERFQISELSKVMQHGNPHSQQICIVGRSRESDKFQIVTYFGNKTSDSGESGLLVAELDEVEASKGFRGYEGIVFTPPESRFARPPLVFVRNLILDR